MLMKTGILYFTTCFHGFGILRHVDPFVRMLHIWSMFVCVHTKSVHCKRSKGNVKDIIHSSSLIL